MSVTAQWVFERAVALMDEGDEDRGAMDTAETRPYKHRTLGILNILGEECREAAGQEEPWAELEGFDQALALEEGLARQALPYGLAAHLFLGEDPAAANFFQQRYEELLARRRKASRAEFEALELPYGGLSARETGRWGRWQ